MRETQVTAVTRGGRGHQGTSSVIQELTVSTSHTHSPVPTRDHSGAPPQRPPHSAAHTAAAAQSVCGLWRVHGQYLMLGNACLRRRQSSDARGASPGQKERHEDITALYEQVCEFTHALENGALGRPMRACTRRSLTWDAWCIVLCVCVVCVCM